MTYKRFVRRIRQNRVVAAMAWPGATALHATSSVMSKFTEKVRRNGGTVTYAGIALCFPPDVGIQFLSDIHWRGIDGYEPDVWRVLRELLPSSGSFIDVGAHIGFFSVLAHRMNPALSVFSFEPEPHALDEAKKFLAANGVSIQGLHQVALSNKDGEATLFLPLDYPTMGSIEGPPPGLQSEEIRVSCQRLDTFLSHRPISDPVTIKIDVEDHEFTVLEGARETISRHRPVIVCELLPRPHNAETIRLLQEMEYAIFAISKNGCFRMGPDDFVQARVFREFVMIPAERIGPEQCFVPFERLGMFNA